MFVFFLINALVYQKGDTLLFVEHDSIVDRWVVSSDIEQGDSLEIKVSRKAKVSSNNNLFLIYEERRGPNYEHLQSQIVFYDTDKRVLWSESHDDTMKILFDLSDIYDSLFVIVVSDASGRNPELYVINDSLKKNTVIEKNEWIRLLSYKISPNKRFLVAHTRKLHFRKPWDYIYFIDLKTKKNWEYLFPTCVSCKRARISVDIDDTGEVEVVYKAEHRVFSKEGKLIDIYQKIE